MILFALLVCWASVAIAERETVTDERGFVIDASGYFASYGKTAVGYVGEEEVLVIPEDLDAVIFQSRYSNDHVKVISLKYFDSSKTEFSLFADYPALERFIGPDDPSSIFVVDDGVLLQKRFYEKGLGWIDSSVVRYPAAKKGAYTIPDWIKYVDGFSNATGLTAITFSDSVTSIGSDAFSGCTALKTIEIPSTVSAVYSNAFQGCTSLQTVTISEGVTYIDSGAFADCTALKTLRIPASVISIGDGIIDHTECVLDVAQGSAAHKYAFMHRLTYTIDGKEPSADNCGEVDGFAYFVREDGNVTICRCDLVGDIAIPATINGYTVDNLEERLFYGKYGITSVSIPATVKYFGSNMNDNLWDYVFSYCYDLQAIHVDSNNPVFCSEDGVLFLKSKSWLINYPCARRAVSYHVKEGTHLCCTSFAGVQYLEALYLDDQQTTWKTYTFYRDQDLTVYYMPGGAAAARAKQDTYAQFREFDASIPEPVIQEIVQLTEKSFPDAAFRQVLAEQFDANQNQWLDELEIRDAKSLDVDSMNIASMEGIKYLSELESLYCSGNQLETLDVSNCNKLEILNCYSNRLTELNISGCVNLQHLDCQSNKLETLDVSDCTNLNILDCSYNQLTCLDLNVQDDAYLYVNAYENVRTVIAKDNAFDLETLSGFDVSRAENWEGGTVNGTILTVKKSGYVFYSYDCGNGKSVDFTLKVKRPWETEIEVLFSPTENEKGVCWTNRDGVGLTFTIPTLKDMRVLKLPSSLKTIQEEAFANVSVDAVIVPDGCTAIESRAFMNCPNLIYIRIPSDVRIADDAFLNSPDVAIDQQEN